MHICNSATANDCKKIKLLQNITFLIKSTKNLLSVATLNMLGPQVTFQHWDKHFSMLPWMTGNIYHIYRMLGWRWCGSIFWRTCFSYLSTDIFQHCPVAKICRKLKHSRISSVTCKVNSAEINKLIKYFSKEVGFKNKTNVRITKREQNIPWTGLVLTLWHVWMDQQQQPVNRSTHARLTENEARARDNPKTSQNTQQNQMMFRSSCTTNFNK